MIHNVVASIGYRLNEYIKNSLSLSEEAVIISSLVDLKGNVNPEIENKITIFLINIEEERTAKNGHFQSSPGMNPPSTMNLYLMFSAYFPNFNYMESLRYISLVIEFFQSNNIPKKYFLSCCQHQTKKALFTDPIFSEGFDKPILLVTAESLQPATFGPK